YLYIERKVVDEMRGEREQDKSGRRQHNITLKEPGTITPHRARRDLRIMRGFRYEFLDRAFGCFFCHLAPSICKRIYECPRIRAAQVPCRSCAAFACA